MYLLRPYLHAQHGRMMLRIRNECIAYEPDFHGNCTNLWRRRGPDHGRMHRQYNLALLGIPSEGEDRSKNPLKALPGLKEPDSMMVVAVIGNILLLLFVLESAVDAQVGYRKYSCYSQQSDHQIYHLVVYFSVLAIDPCIDPLHIPQLFSTW